MVLPRLLTRTKEMKTNPLDMPDPTLVEEACHVDERKG
jgi:hypothetical protein